MYSPQKNALIRKESPAASQSPARPLLVRSCRQIFVSTLCSSRDSSSSFQIKINKKKRSARPLFSFFFLRNDPSSRSRHPSSNKKNKVSREKRILKKNPIEVRGRARESNVTLPNGGSVYLFLQGGSILIIHRD